MNHNFNRLAEEAIARLWNDAEATEQDAAACVSNLIQAAVEAERRACASVARSYRNGNPDAIARIDWTATMIADAIVIHRAAKDASGFDAAADRIVERVDATVAKMSDKSVEE